MKSNEYDSNKQGIEVIDVINTFDKTNSKIFNLEKTMIKPDMSNVITHPNIYIPYETYIPCALDWSDLIEKIDYYE